MSLNEPKKTNPSGPNPIKIKAKREKNYKPKLSEDVYRVGSPIEVSQGDEVVIKVDCQEGFTVFFPNAGFFGDHLYQANDDTSWSDGEDPAENKWWGVSLKRTNMDNPNKAREDGKKREAAYCIYSKDLDNFAVGNSPPKMILDP
jgi:hypothetical protein